MAESCKTSFTDNNEAKYKVLTITQLPQGDYTIEDFNDFIGYYLLNSFTYTVFSVIKHDVYKTERVKRVIRHIGQNYGHMFDRLRTYFEMEDVNIIDIKFTRPDFDKDYSVRIAIGIPTMDIVDVFEDESTIKHLIKVDGFNSTETKLVSISQDLARYIGSVYEEIMKSGSMPNNITDFYKRCIEFDSPLKMITKPYIIDIPYVLSNSTDILEYAKKNSYARVDSESGTESVPDTDRPFWEKMIYRTASMAVHNSSKRYKNKEQADVCAMFETILENANVSKDAILILSSILKTCIFNRYRVLFVREMNEVLTTEQDKIYWEKVRKLCTKLFRVSIYSFK